MEEPKIRYRVAINHKERQYKVFDTEEQAVEFARKMVEADGNHVFMSAKRGCDGLLVLRWMEWADAEPRIVSKIIGVGNKEELKAYRAWRAEQQKIELMKKWEETRLAFYANVKKANEAKKKQPKAIKWVD